jgi:hypothetical protein
MTEDLAAGDAEAGHDPLVGETLRTAEWEAWIATDWPAYVDREGRILGSVLANAQQLAVSRLVRALSSGPLSRAAFQRLPELFDPRIKDRTSAEAAHNREIRSMLATRYLTWLREVLAYCKRSTRQLSSGADALWSEIEQVGAAVADRSPSLLADGKFPFARTMAPPSNPVPSLAQLIGEDLLRKLGSTQSVNRFWSEYGAQEPRPPVRDTDEDDGGSSPLETVSADPLVAWHRPTEERALGPADQEDSLLERHPYLLDWRARAPVEAIAQKYSRDAVQPITPAQMFARILRVINAYAPDEARRPLDESDARRWLEEYITEATRRSAGRQRPEELGRLAAAVLALGRTPEHDDWPEIARWMSMDQAAGKPDRTWSPVTTPRQWYRLLVARPGIAMLAPWESWPKLIEPLHRLLARGRDALEDGEQVDLADRVGQAIERLGGDEQAATAIAARLRTPEPIAFDDIAGSLSENTRSVTWLDVARSLEALRLVPLHRRKGVEAFCDLFDAMSARQNSGSIYPPTRFDPDAIQKWMRTWLTSPPMVALAAQCGWELPRRGQTDDLLARWVDLVSAWDFRAGKERHRLSWSDVTVDGRTVDDDVIVCCARMLGLVDGMPLDHGFSQLVILGGMVRAYQRRTAFARSLYDEQETRPDVALLSGHRLLAEDEKEDAQAAGWGTLSSESEVAYPALVEAFDLAAVPLISDRKDVKAVPADASDDLDVEELRLRGTSQVVSWSIPAPERGDASTIILLVASSGDPATRRANTADQLAQWAEVAEIGPDDCVVLVTTAHYCLFQQLAALRLLAKERGCEVRTTGVPWRPDGPKRGAGYLQEIRSMLLEAQRLLAALPLTS